MMLEPRFDHIRAAILGEPRDGFLVVACKIDPEHTGTELDYSIAPDQNGRDRLGVVASYFGLVMGTDSRLARPKEEIAEEDAVLASFTVDDVPRAA